MTQAPFTYPQDDTVTRSDGPMPWQTVGPSAVPYADGWHTPEALGDNSLKRVRDAFVGAAER